MTELEKNVDREVGNATEHARVTFLTFVNYGRQLEAEKRASEGQFSKQDVLNAIDEVLGALKDTAVKQSVVEKVDEDEAFQAIKTSAAPEDADLVARFEALLNAVDQKHTELYQAQSEQLKSIRAKYE